MSRPRLLFISPRFLFPAHSGGAIRTGQVLRGMKGGRFAIKLLSPGSSELGSRYRSELSELADDWEFWPAVSSEDRSQISKARHLLSNLPLAVAADHSDAARRVIERNINAKPSIVVGDFVHSAVLLPERIDVPTVIFTHNCEAEIYERHAEQAARGWMSALWRSQAAKMRRFEGRALLSARKVVAVAERDAKRFERDYGVGTVDTIPTGVELDAYRWRPPEGRGRVVFAGSMDSPANIYGIEWMIEHVWARVVEAVPSASMTVIGKEPPARLVRLGDSLPGWSFTGRVEEVAPYLSGADAFVIPLWVGGGTRMKAFEAMAVGAPIVSTSVGIEGLGLQAERDFLVGDDPSTFADAIIRLLRDADLARDLSARARAFVEAYAAHHSAAHRFEEICWEAHRAQSRSTAGATTGLGVDETVEVVLGDASPEP